MAVRANKSPGEIVAISDFLEHRMKSILISTTGAYLKSLVYFNFSEFHGHKVTPPHISGLHTGVSAAWNRLTIPNY